jgi:DNA-binding beta-propeller fold protein YncE
VGRGLAAALVAAATVAAAEPAAAQQPLASWGATGKAPDQFQRLGGIAADARGYVYAADYQGGGVLKYTATGQYVRTFGRPRPPRNIGDPAPIDQISLPEGVAVGPDGNVYVVESGSDRTRVSVWTPLGRFVRAFGDYGSGPGQLSSPGQVAVDGAGFVYVADSANSRVEKFTPDGAFAASIGQGTGFFAQPDQLATPKGVAVAPDGTIYAADELYRRVQHYTADGAFLGSFGSQGSGDGQFQAPAGVVAGPDGVYVADRSLSSIQRFSAAGAFLARVGGGPGSGPGQFSHPSYLALDCGSTLYVADRDNNRIQRLGVAGAPPCGDPAHDPAERLRVTATARTPQRFARVFAIGVTVACDRPCTAKVSGTVKIAGRRHALRIRTQTRKLDGVAALKVNVAPGERDTDRVLAALRRHRRVVATVRAAASDARGQRTTIARRVRLR